MSSLVMEDGPAWNCRTNSFIVYFTMQYSFMNLSYNASYFAISCYFSKLCTTMMMMIIRAHSYPRQNLTNSAENLVNSAENLVNFAARQMKSRGSPPIHS